MGVEIDPRDCGHGWADTEQTEIDRLRAKLAEQGAELVELRAAGNNLRAKLDKAQAVVEASGELIEYQSDKEAADTGWPDWEAKYDRLAATLDAYKAP